MPPLISLQSVAAEEPQEIMQADSGVVTFGRGTENLIVVDSEAVSRRHACLIATDNNWVFRDFESTNGSRVNGVRLSPGQSRLVRHGDVIQLADFPLRIVDLNYVEVPADQTAPSLLVFYSDHFEAEIFMEEPGSRFAIGGPEGQFFIEGVPDHVVQLEISQRASRLELSTGQGSIPVIVNGIAARGVTALSDRDEVGIDSYRIIISDLRHGAAALAQPKPRAKTDRAIYAYERPNAPEHLRRESEQRAAADWESEAARRRSQSGKRFVFGSEPAQENETVTTLGFTSPRYSAPGPAKGFEMSVSQRFAAAIAEADARPRNPVWEMFVTVFGVIFFVAILAAIFWLIL